MAAVAYKHEEVAKTPRGWRVRSRSRGRHVVRIAFPPGPRRKGAGQVVEILHPRDEKNPSCILSNQAKTNPGELLIFGNPKGGNPETVESRKSKVEKQRAARERAARIRGARLNPDLYEVVEITPADVPSVMTKPLSRKEAKKFLGEMRTLHQKAGTGNRYIMRRVKNPKRATPRRRRKDRRNPSEEQQAVQLYKSFHGKDPNAIVEKHVSAAMRLEYTALGNLEYIKVITPIGQKAEFHFDSDHVKLASSPDGKQLYAIGGNQNLASCIDKDSLEKDFIDVGEAQEVSYLARKVHGDFRPVSYYHRFGEKTGGKPQLMFDKLKKQIFFVGGEYFIDTSKGVSPGIEN